MEQYGRNLRKGGCTILSEGASRVKPEATTTVAVQAVTGSVPNKDYQLLLDRLLKLMREQMGERLLGLDLKARLLPSAEEESLTKGQEKE